MKKLMMSVAAAALMLSIGSSSMTAQLSKEPSAADKVRIVGWALNMSNIATGANQTIQIDIDGWSNPSQRQPDLWANCEIISVRGWAGLSFSSSSSLAAASQMTWDWARQFKYSPSCNRAATLSLPS